MSERTLSPGNIALSAFSVIVLFVLVAPILVIVLVSFTPGDLMQFPPQGFSLRWYQRYFEDPQWQSATALSFLVAGLTAVFSLVLGFLTSLALVRGRFPGKNALRIFLMSPLIIPKIIVAVGLYFLYVRMRILGTTFGLVAAHTLIAMPYVVMILSAALFGFDRRLEWAARNLGASPLKTLWHVTLPLLRPAIISAALFAFIASFDDIILSLFLTKLSAPTLPRQIWVNVQQVIDPTIAAVSTLMTLISVLGLWLVALIQRMAARGAR
ncbi:ABC transporter permease [Azorhizobium oxalatiphilum]|uniref:ABC transporter permease n=1 Tax=Azorhizobium oxalatiphilum TaxID=980631 RepID=A0A917BS02_9HYPH|nr:ABC transporter permease [Azorhizobium oxalatiphilum]GGF54725.1 ABC transporter permease [Azorhizobium oxalatiphilum]